MNCTYIRVTSAMKHAGKKKDICEEPKKKATLLIGAQKGKPKQR